jgi:hypothetical protein
VSDFAPSLPSCLYFQSVEGIIHIHNILEKEEEQECNSDQLREEVPDTSEDGPISFTVVHHNTQKVSRASHTTEV